MTAAELTYVFAKLEDVEEVLRFAKELIEHQSLIDDVEHEPYDEKLLKRNLFGRKKYAEVIFAIYKGQKVGYALFFYNFSTFSGKPGLYLEDLYIREKYRRFGFGRKMIGFLGEIAAKRGCCKIEWQCLDKNKPANDFYASLGAKRSRGWSHQYITIN